LLWRRFCGGRIVCEEKRIKKKTEEKNGSVKSHQTYERI
jgi:hypothetical protein